MILCNSTVTLIFNDRSTGAGKCERNVSLITVIYEQAPGNKSDCPRRTCTLCKHSCGATLRYVHISLIYFNASSTTTYKLWEQHNFLRFLNICVGLARFEYLFCVGGMPLTRFAMGLGALCISTHLPGADGLLRALLRPLERLKALFFMLPARFAKGRRHHVSAAPTRLSEAAHRTNAFSENRMCAVRLMHTRLPGGVRVTSSSPPVKLKAYRLNPEMCTS